MNSPFSRAWRVAFFYVLGMLLSSVTLAHSQEIEDSWKYSLTKPESDDWSSVEFDDSNWEEGFGGFGTAGTPNSRISTRWDSKNIWMRKNFALESIPTNAALLIYHDEDAIVYLNGKQIANLEGYVSEYKRVPLNADVAKELKQGDNLLAIHCRQTNGGQFIDAHIIDADAELELPPPKYPKTPFKTPLTTKWGQEVTAENAWTQYPRPNLARENWINLNGNWDYQLTSDKQTDIPSEWEGKILVPFCLESSLSGVQKRLAPDQALWYSRSVELQKADDKSLLLNFEAVDYQCEVFVNGQSVGGHKGGNVPFQLDITDAAKSGTNLIQIRVEDDTEAAQLRGKQVLWPEGIWYTQVSGIWQTVWLEQVSKNHLDDLKITSDYETKTIKIRGLSTGSAKSLKVAVFDGETQVASATGLVNEEIQVKVPNGKLWSPDSPFLYGLKIDLQNTNGQVVDSVSSYAGIRGVGKIRDENGDLRFTLNGKPIFHWGPLDQGWWPDGLLTPPSDDAMRFDIDYLKAAGFNMIRKHIKVEPRRYYWYCDMIGMMVWQDQVSGGKGPAWTRLDKNPNDAKWKDEDHQQFMVEFEEMIDSLENHPCIVVWTPFNEAWGQHRTMEVGQWTVKRDPSRSINIASGGNFWPVGDVVDQHAYPHPDFPFDEQRYKDYVKVVGEFGGHGLTFEGHLWDATRGNWGYGGLPKDQNEYRERYVESIRRLAELKGKGISAGVYTQTTDVEVEVNGLMTYDRRVIKIPAEELKRIHEKAELLK